MTNTNRSGISKADTTVHLIGNAHLDPVWLWQWQEGYAEIKATFRSALDRLRDFPDFVFTCACAAYYQWVEQNEPLMFEEIKQRVAEGRWVIVGGWWIQPDCNLPSGESFARHSLYGQRYFASRFGRMARVGYNVDSFGHHAMLPQLLKLSGMDYYVFMRPQQHEKPLPANLFWWESPDGSRVLTFRLSDAYTVRDASVLAERIAKHASMAEAEGVPYMSFYGVGNHGGGPTIANLHTIHTLQETHDNWLLSSPNAFFNEIVERELDVPVIRDELQHHAVGCYSTHSESKRLNRKAEHRLLSAEKLSSLAAILRGLPYPQQQLQTAWENVMFNQFHDIMGGCSIREAFDDARESYGEALHIGAKALNAAVQKLSWSIGTMKPQIAALSKEKDWHLWEQGDLGVPYVVFNPLSWELDALVQANKRLASVEDELGNALPIQSVRASRTNGSDKWDTLFPARVPAFGYRVFWMYRDRPAVHPWPRTGMLEAAEDRLENELVRIVLDRQTGYIKQLYDKRLNCDLFRADAAVPVVLDETDSDTWGHNRDRYRNEIGKFSGATLKLIENGPLRATIGVTSCYGTSSLRQYVSLRHDSSVVQVRVDLDWREKHRMLKLSFPAGVKEPHATWEIPYGHLSRPVDGKEVPGQSWVYVSGQAVSAAASSESAEGLLMSSPVIGVGIANDAKYGYDVLEHEIRLTVVRSPIYADHYGQRDEWVEYMDQGQQQFQYSIISHPGHWQESGIQRKADELNVPPITIWETYHEGELPQCYEGVRISSPQVSVTALKRAEDNNGWIARCHETLGKPTAVQIELPALQRVWQAVFGASEVKTFAIPDDADLPVGEVNFIEHIVRE